MPCCLRAVGHDTQLDADHAIEQGGLANVGASHDHSHAGTGTYVTVSILERAV